MNDIQPENGPDHWDPDHYGRQFADVYDLQHGVRGDEPHVVATVGPPRGTGRLLELGVGTGRLARPLAAATWSVHGLDASAEMVSTLVGSEVTVHLGDASRVEEYPEGPFEVVLAAFNFICNLPTEAHLVGMFNAAASVSAPDGSLWLEAPPAPIGLLPGERFTASERGGSVVHTTVTAVHGDTVTVRCVRVEPDGRTRTWGLTFTDPDRLDVLARQAGWQRVNRFADWQHSPWTTEATNVVTRYVRNAPVAS